MKIPLRPPGFKELMDSVVSNPDAMDRMNRIMTSGLGAAPDGRYRHWQTLRYITPPDDLTHEEWWLGIKMARSFLRHTLPLTDTHGSPMHYTTPDILHKMCSVIDRNSAGSIQTSEPGLRLSGGDFYIVKSLADESIASSQLEGASTTREVANEMIRTKRPPMNKSERMIVNNYHAMMLIQKINNLPLTPEIIVDIHRSITDGTLDDPEAAGRLRREDEDIRIYDETTGEILHTPPPARELRARMKAMCAFANDLESQDFIHPVVRAILLHFWLAYDHPFVDGNGRTARALFYWSMARQKYWLFEFISISRIIHEGPAKYARSFLYTETDDNDITYFLLNQLSVVLRAIDELHTYVQRKEAELMEVRDVLAKTRFASAMFNHRQMAIINHGLKHANAVYTTESHRHSHNVSPQTARTDLLELAEAGLLMKQQRGRAYVFISPGNLKSRLIALAPPDSTQ